jgi:hypothetical protein
MQCLSSIQTCASVMQITVARDNNHHSAPRQTPPQGLFV